MIQAPPLSQDRKRSRGSLSSWGKFIDAPRCCASMLTSCHCDFIHPLKHSADQRPQCLFLFSCGATWVVGAGCSHQQSWGGRSAQCHSLGKKEWPITLQDSLNIIWEVSANAECLAILNMPNHNLCLNRTCSLK
jgi:hypothetical protein